MSCSNECPASATSCKEGQQLIPISDRDLLLAATELTKNNDDHMRLAVTCDVASNENISHFATVDDDHV